MRVCMLLQTPPRVGSSLCVFHFGLGGENLLGASLSQLFAFADLMYDVPSLHFVPPLFELGGLVCGSASIDWCRAHRKRSSKSMLDVITQPVSLFLFSFGAGAQVLFP